MQYVALFAGPNVKSARLICAITDPRVIASVAKAGLKALQLPPDPVLVHIAKGNQGALEEVIKAAGSKSGAQE
jgi:hypothetical protein